MESLNLHHDYDRRTVHEIFDPESTFTPRAGTWGIHGIVSIPDRSGDFVFFVTQGKQQGDHKFDESITDDGVLTWQSQPRQNLSNPAINQFINHDELINSIHLFLRTNKKNKYTYLGQLSYISHDMERANPCHFQWQLLDWPIEQSVLLNMGLECVSLKSESHKNKDHKKEQIAKSGLVLTSAPSKRATKEGAATNDFTKRKKPDYSKQDAANRKLGLMGEELVVKNEVKTLSDGGCGDLAGKVSHVAKVEGDGAGYDVKSYDIDGNVKYIEVKTTCGGINTSFFLSSNELAFSKNHPEHYYLYRLYDYDKETKSGKCFIVEGDISKELELSPTQYRARI